jgi:hypothetical protein
MIGKLFDRFVEWSLNRQESHLMKEPKPKRKVSRVRRKANAKKKNAT